jgi:hypothetical protein
MVTASQEQGGSEVDDRRFQELVEKRDTSGLTNEEANELGRLIAEREGQHYSNASDQDHPERQAGEDQPYSEAEVQELKEHPEVRDTPEESEKAS